MAVEARRAARNERRQRAHGGVEPPGDVYPFMRVLYPAGFLLILLAGAWVGEWPRSAIWCGALLFAASKALKWWAIVTLGDFWTFRVIVIPGMRPIDSGPYRLMRHPNYVAVVGEFLSVTLICGAIATGLAVTATFFLLILRRVRLEERAVRQAR